MERREFLKDASLGAIGAMVATRGMAQQPATPAVDKPNIIFIVTDQRRAGLTKRSGYPLDTSPTLDRLAEAGVGFDRAYATTPLCVPSRTSMLTGRWPEAHHVRMNLDPQDAFFETDLYQVAKANGYRTGLAGKNHTYLKQTDLDFWREYSHWRLKITTSPRVRRSNTGNSSRGSESCRRMPRSRPRPSPWKSRFPIASCPMRSSSSITQATSLSSSR